MSGLTTLVRTCLALTVSLAAACGNVSDTGDDVVPDAPPASGLTYYKDVAPIVMDHCAGCHRPGGVAPFSLLTYDDAFDTASAMAEMVRTRQMPPWGADNSGECNTFRDARWLTDAEIATVVDWAASERAPGDPADGPPPPELPPGLARVDATAAMAEPYTFDAGLSDDYRCFIVDPGIATDAFLTGFEVRPGAPEVVHHILVFQFGDAQSETDAAALDAQAAGPGYTCFGGPGVGSTSLIGVWAPGMRVASYPDGTGLPVKGGRKMLLQIHYHDHGGGPVPDQTAVDLMTESTVTDPSFLFMIAAPDLYLPPNEPAVSTTNQLTLPAFLPQYNVWGVFPHMHTLGKQLRVEVDHAGETACMVDVPRWNFNWQQGYFYDGPPKIAGGGDTLRITCTHDTTSRVGPTTWGEGTEDEMCLAFLYVSAY